MIMWKYVKPMTQTENLGKLLTRENVSKRKKVLRDRAQCEDRILAPFKMQER